MRVVLDSTLEVSPSREPEISVERIDSFGRELGVKVGLSEYDWRSKTYSGAQLINSDIVIDAKGLKLGFMGLLADCYSRHEKLTIQPHDLWFIVLSEVAKEVNKNSEKYRSIFTKSAGKVDIMVPGCEELDIEAVISHLRVLVPSNLDTFLPRLSTAFAAEDIAMAATFCDMVQSYYNYMTFCCGLPEIEVTGTAEDWQALSDCSRALMATFIDAGGPIIYFAKLFKLFENIADQVRRNEPNVDFWRDIFRTKNIGSGGELAVNGWIRDLYLEQRGDKLENFLVSVGSVPYTNVDTGRKFTAVYGAFGVVEIDGFLRSTYDHFTFERE